MPPELSYSKLLLRALFATAQGIVKTISISNDIARWHKAYMQGGLEYVNQLKQMKRKRSLEAAFYNLKRSQYVKTKKVGDKLILALTSKGVQLMLKNKILKSPKLKNNLYTLIIFDIPESQRQARSQLRLFLRETNFKQLQKSVWITRQDVYDELSQFLKQLRVENWVNLALIQKLLKRP